MIRIRSTIAKSTLRNFWELRPQYGNSKASLEDWHAEAKKASWQTPKEIKAQYRITVSIDYARQACFIKFVGTHKEYDLIDAESYNGYSPNKN